MGTASPQRGLSLALAGAALALLLANPLPPPWLGSQRAITAALLPDFHVLSLQVVKQQGHQSLHLQCTNRRHLVMQGQVQPPGIDFSAWTPQRHGVLLAALTLLAGALALWRRRQALWPALAVVVPVAALQGMASGPLMLAGQVWSLGVLAWSEPSPEALLVGLAEQWLQGAGLALAALAAGVARAWTQQARTSRHPRLPENLTQVNRGDERRQVCH